MRLAVAGCSLDNLHAVAGRAAAEGVGLLVLPEHGTGCTVLAEPSDGDLGRRLSAIARETGVALLAGYPERCVTGVYNAAMLFDRRGVCLANYRQTHLRSADRPAWERGQWLSVVPLDGHRLGLLIGYDIEFPEPARALALAGCDVLAVLGGASDDGGTVPELVLPARARENACWIAYAALAGCAVIGPDGLRRAGGDGLRIVDLDAPAEFGREHPALLADRRPRLYEELVHLPEEQGRPD